VLLPAGADPSGDARCPLCNEEYALSEVFDNLPPELELLNIPAAEVTPSPEAAEAAAAMGAVLDLGEPLPLSEGEQPAEKDEAGDGDEAAAAATEEADAAVEGEEAADEGEPDQVDSGMPSFDFDRPSGEDEAAEQEEGMPDILTGDAGVATAVEGEEGEEAGDEPLKVGAAEDVLPQSVPPIDFGSTDGDGAAVSDKPVSARPRPARRQKNMGAEMVKIVLGGIAGLAIAQMIIWWAMHRDPLGLGPVLPGFLSFLAPADVRGESDSAENEDAPPKETDQTDKTDKTDKPDPAPPPQDKRPTSPDSDIVVPGSGAGGSQDAGKKKGGRPKKGPKPDQPDENFVGIRNPPKYASDKLLEVLQQAGDCRTAFEDSGSLGVEEKKDRARKFFDGLCTLGEKVTFVDTSDENAVSIVGAIEGFLLQMAESGQNRLIIGTLAESHLDEHDSGGVILLGTVKEISERGRLFETRLELVGRRGQPEKRVVSVMSARAPGGKYKEGAQVLVLGVIVVDPSAKLGGYQGDLPKVIWGGYPVNITDVKMTGG